MTELKWSEWRLNSNLISGLMCSSCLKFTLFCELWAMSGDVGVQKVYQILEYTQSFVTITIVTAKLVRICLFLHQ